MKLLFTSLGVFLLFLACVPCSDREECNINQEETISTAADHDQHSHESENCTPFCTCSCCAFSSYYSPLYKTLLVAMATTPQEYSLFNIAFNTEAHYSIWQPPKFS